MALCIASGGRMLYIFRLIVNAVSLGAPICRSVYLPSPLLFLNQALIIHSLSLFIQLSLSLSLYVDLLLCLCLSVSVSVSLSPSLSPSLTPFTLPLSPLFLKVVSFPGDFSYAAAGLILLECTAGAQWSAELLVITYGGGLRSYLVRWVRPW
jgi:hypothetical protein